jgi:hypothetical protein
MPILILKNREILYDIVLLTNHYDNAVYFVHIVYNRHFLPCGRADLTVSASLQRSCGGPPQLPPLRLTSTATSARE